MALSRRHTAFRRTAEFANLACCLPFYVHFQNGGSNAAQGSASCALQTKSICTKVGRQCQNHGIEMALKFAHLVSALPHGPWCEPPITIIKRNQCAKELRRRFFAPVQQAGSARSRGRGTGHSRCGRRCDQPPASGGEAWLVTGRRAAGEALSRGLPSVMVVPTSSPLRARSRAVVYLPPPGLRLPRPPLTQRPRPRPPAPASPAPRSGPSEKHYQIAKEPASSS